MTRPDRLLARAAWLALGLTALALAGLGVLLPLLPTTPFVLVAAFAFARSSKRLERWLLDHPLFGRLIANWRRYGAIDRFTKIVGISSMAAVLAISVLLRASTAVLVIQALVLAACAAFVASRPTPPEA